MLTEAALLYPRIVPEQECLLILIWLVYILNSKLVHLTSSLIDIDQKYG